MNTNVGNVESTSSVIGPFANRKCKREATSNPKINNADTGAIKKKVNIRGTYE